MKVLVLAAAYPDLDGNVSLMYVHTRNVMYSKNGIEVYVLNFAARSTYCIDGVRVLPERAASRGLFESFDIIIAHAPSIRKHFRLLRRYIDVIPRLVIFGHGHEFLRINDCYPPEYSFAKNRLRRATVQNAYDSYKLRCWRKFITENKDRITLVMVSRWMKDAFCRYVLQNKAAEGMDIRIINNGVGEVFLERSYNVNDAKDYDFITIRSNVDSSKYCVDIVAKAARLNPDNSFLLIGKGDYFDYYEPPKNITFIRCALPHDELLEYVDKSKIALMPTRQDTQGVMTCELATYGIPVITSDIDVCREMLSSFPNVTMFDTDSLPMHLREVAERFNSDFYINSEKNLKFSDKNTVSKEIALLKELEASTVG